MVCHVQQAMGRKVKIGWVTHDLDITGAAHMESMGDNRAQWSQKDIRIGDTIRSYIYGPKWAPHGFLARAFGPRWRTQHA